MLTVETFLDQLRGRRVRLFEDNQAVVTILTNATTRSPELMRELRKLWHLLDHNGIELQAEYIRSAANTWADGLSRMKDDNDWRLHPRLLKEMDVRWGPHTVDRFATANNAHLPRYNAAYLDPLCEAVDAMAQDWRWERTWVNPPWELLSEVVAKLEQSGAAATVVAPCWPNAPWFPQLAALSDEIEILLPRRDLFLPGRLGSSEPVGKPGWRVMLCRVKGRPPTATATTSGPML